MSKRRRFSAEFKAKVALDALSGELTLTELASKYGVHSNMISTWKRQARESIVECFAGKAMVRRNNREAEIKDLLKKIGQLTVGNDSLWKALARPRLVRGGGGWSSKTIQGSVSHANACSWV